MTKRAAKAYNDLVTVVSAMPEVHVGSVLPLTGEWTMNPKFGRQFSIAVDSRQVIYRTLNA